jgi:hypothetical protein
MPVGVTMLGSKQAVRPRHDPIGLASSFRVSGKLDILELCGEGSKSSQLEDDASLMRSVLRESEESPV